jgi:CheY-like chemotaxis protein
MKKILLVDDEKVIRDLFSELLEIEFKIEEIDHAEDGIVARTKSLNTKYDLIILDHMMPRLDGSTFLEMLRNTENINQKTPVVMVTANLPTLTSNMETLNNTLYLTKPVNFDKLKRFINMATNK